MNIKYRILSVDDKEKSFVVRYFTDIITEQYLNTQYDIDGDMIMDSNGYPLSCRTDYNLEIQNSDELTLENLSRKIEQSVPIDWLKKQEQINSNNFVTMSPLYNLIGVEKDLSVNNDIDVANSFLLNTNLEEILTPIVANIVNKIV